MKRYVLSIVADYYHPDYNEWMLKREIAGRPLPLYYDKDYKDGSFHTDNIEKATLYKTANAAKRNVVGPNIIELPGCYEIVEVDVVTTITKQTPVVY